MREIICTVKRSRGSKRRPKVMTAIGRTHPTSGTRHTTNFSLKKKRHECSVLLFYKHESHLTTASVLQLALLPRFSLLGRGGLAQLRPHLTVKMLRLE